MQPSALLSFSFLFKVTLSLQSSHFCKWWGNLYAPLLKLGLINFGTTVTGFIHYSALASCISPFIEVNFGTSDFAEKIEFQPQVLSSWYSFCAYAWQHFSLCVGIERGWHGGGHSSREVSAPEGRTRWLCCSEDVWPGIRSCGTSDEDYPGALTFDFFFHIVICP